MFFRPQAAVLAVLALSSIAQASWLDGQINNIGRRQDTPEISQTTTAPPTTTSPPATSSTESHTSETSSAPPPTTSSETTTPPPSITSETLPPTTSSTIPSTTSEPPTSTTTSSSTTSTESEEETSKTSAPPSVTKETTTASLITTSTPTVIRVTLTRTVDGQVQTTVSETTSSALTTQTRAPSNQGESNESSGGGMSTGTRNTIIGVVVGIGGAILLGGLAIVAWRIWGRKKSAEEGDELMGYNRPDTSGHEKSGNASSAGSNPFQSTLESYHAPAKPVNASSNF